MPSNPLLQKADIVNDDLFTLLGVPGASDEQKQKIMSSMIVTVQNRVLARLMDLFDEQEREQLNAALEKKDLKAVDEMLAAKGMPEFLALVAQEAILYKAEAYELVNTQET